MCHRCIQAPRRCLEPAAACVVAVGVGLGCVRHGVVLVRIRRRRRRGGRSATRADPSSLGRPHALQLSEPSLADTQPSAPGPGNTYIIVAKASRKVLTVFNAELMLQELDTSAATRQPNWWTCVDCGPFFHMYETQSRCYFGRFDGYQNVHTNLEDTKGEPHRS
jgi:hypothetical protein